MSRIPRRQEVRKINGKRRVAGSAPDLGKLGKVRNKPQRRRRRSKHGQHDNSSGRSRPTSRILVNWLILILFLVGAGFGGVFLWSVIDRKESQPLPAVIEEAPPLKSDLAQRMVNDLLSAQSPSDLDSLIRARELDTREAFNFLSELRKNETSEPTPIWFGSIDSLSIPIEAVTLNYPDTPSRLVLFALDSHGNWKIDFDAFARLCVPDFQTVIDRGEEGGLVRVHVSIDNYFNGRFREEGKWKCYRLSYPETRKAIFGYCKSGTPAGAAMEAIQRRSDLHASPSIGAEIETSKAGAFRRAPVARATLRIRRPADAEEVQFEISEVISDDWVVSESSFQDDFSNPAQQ